MLKVLMTADAIGGVWQYGLELAGGLGQRGVSVLLAVMGGGVTDAKREEVRRLLNVRIVENACKLEWMESPWQAVDASGEWLLRIADDFEPDFIHLNGYAHGALPWKSPVVVVAHSCVLSWFQAVRGEAAPNSWKKYRNAVRGGLRSADLVVTPSAVMLDAIRSHYGDPGSARVISNGRDPGAFQPGAKANIILSAGRLWDDAKNFSILADAAPDVHWPIFVAGESEHPEGGCRAFSGLHRLGKLDSEALAGWYSRSAIYASPALYEPFGLTVLEAALSGCALVLSDIPTFREIWGNAACYVDPRDAAAWRDQLNTLIFDPAKRLEVAERARKRGLQLTATKMTNEYLEAYEQARTYRQCASLSSAIPYDPIGITAMPTFSAA